MGPLPDSLPTWRPASADVSAWIYPITARTYFDEVIHPSVQSIDRRIAQLITSEDDFAPFALSDAQELRAATMTAFCLSIQALWERQIRGYLVSCAKEFGKPEFIGDIQHANRKKLPPLFFELRSVELTAFPSFPDLDLLLLVGNVCRHGDGASAKELFKNHPEFWPAHSPELDLMGLAHPSAPDLGAELLNLPIERLDAFTAAIVSFWEDANFIYNNSLKLDRGAKIAGFEEKKAAFRARWIKTS